MNLFEFLPQVNDVFEHDLFSTKVRLQEVLRKLPLSQINLGSLIL
jgi:hypothetical protein